MLVVNNFNNLTRWKVTNIVLSSSRSSKILATINEGYSVQASTRCGNLTAADVEVRSGAAVQSAGNCGLTAAESNRCLLKLLTVYCYSLHFHHDEVQRL